MRNLSNRILERASRAIEGAPLCAKELLHLGKRAAIDQALSRLAREGQLMKVGRGLYVLPVKTRFGVAAPSAEAVVKGIARITGETVTPHGASAANVLGLTTQVPMRLIYLTSGPTRELKLGNQTVWMRHAPQWQLTKPERPAGTAIRALEWLGPNHAEEALSTLKRRLPKLVLEEIAATRATLPQWLAEQVSHELVVNG